MYTLVYDWLDKTTKEYLIVVGLATSVYEDNKYFKSNLLNNNWFIVLLSYIQYRTYKSGYYQKYLTPKALDGDRKEFARKHPQWTKVFKFCQDLGYISVPWIFFTICIVDALVNVKTGMNFFIYAYSLMLIAMYVLSNKDTSRSLYKLIIAWNIGIGMTIIIFMVVLIYQVL